MHLNETISKCEAMEVCYDAVTHAGSKILAMIHDVDPNNAADVATALQSCMVDWDEHCEAVHDCVKAIDEAVLDQCSQDLGFSEDDVVVLSEYPECGCYHVSAIGLPNRKDPTVYTVWLSRIERVEKAQKVVTDGSMGIAGWVSAENSSDLMFNGDAHHLGIKIRQHPGKLKFSRAQLDACALRIVKASSNADLEKIVTRVIDTEEKVNDFVLNFGSEYLDTSPFKSAGYSVAGRDHIIALSLMDHMAPALYPQYDFNESDLVLVKFSDEKKARVVVFVNIDVANGCFCYLDGENCQIVFSGHNSSISEDDGDEYLNCSKPLSKTTSMSLVMGKDIHGLDCSGPAEAVLLAVYAQKENLRMRIGRFAANQKA